MSFYLTARGQIESCKMQAGDDLYVRYCIVFGKDWKFLHGIERGTSQIARRPSGEDAVFVWNHPLDLTVKSTNVFGWPRLVVSVIGHSLTGKEIIKGYGCVNLPTTSGRHTRYINLYTPKSSSLCLRLTSWLMGTPPEFFEPTFIAQGVGRGVTRVTSSGTAKVVLNISTKDMQRFGYRSSGPDVEMNSKAFSSNNNIAFSAPPSRSASRPATPASKAEEVRSRRSSGDSDKPMYVSRKKSWSRSNNAGKADHRGSSGLGSSLSPRAMDKYDSKSELFTSRKSRLRFS